MNMAAINNDSALQAPIRQNDKRFIDPKLLDNLRQTVLRLFSQGQYHEIGLRKIAKEAGVSFHTIYKYYGNKEQLLFSCIKPDLDELNRIIAQEQEKHEHSIDKLKVVLDRFFRFYATNIPVARISCLTISPESWMNNTGMIQSELHANLQKVLKGGQEKKEIVDDFSADYLMDMAICMSVRVVTRWLLEGCTYSLVDEVDKLVLFFYRAVATE